MRLLSLISSDRNTEYSLGPEGYLLSAVDCRGMEDSLLLCPSSGWRRHLPGTTTQCEDDHHAAVKCYDDSELFRQGAGVESEHGTSARWTKIQQNHPTRNESIEFMASGPAAAKTWFQPAGVESSFHIQHPKIDPNLGRKLWSWSAGQASCQLPRQQRAKPGARGFEADERFADQASSIFQFRQLYREISCPSGIN